MPQTPALTTTTQLATGGPTLDRLIKVWAETYRSPHTRSAYANDMGAWATWCSTYGADPLTSDPRALEALANRWRLVLEGDADTLADHPGPAPRVMAPASIARRLSAVGGFYRWAKRQGVVMANPVAEVVRPMVDDTTTTLGPTLDETAAMVRAAEGMDDTTGALVRLLATTGLRVSEALSLNVGDVTTEDGHVLVSVVGKGGRRRFAPFPTELAEALQRAQGDRATGPLFVDAVTGGRLTRHQAAYRVRRAAQLAGVPKRLTPHTLRHGYATEMGRQGVPIANTQDAMGHRSPVTTQRYNRTRNALTGHPNYSMGTALARAMGEG